MLIKHSILNIKEVYSMRAKDFPFEICDKDYKELNMDLFSKVMSLKTVGNISGLDIRVLNVIRTTFTNQVVYTEGKGFYSTDKLIREQNIGNTVKYPEDYLLGDLVAIRAFEHFRNSFKFNNDMSIFAENSILLPSGAFAEKLLDSSCTKETGGVRINLVTCVIVNSDLLKFDPEIRMLSAGNSWEDIAEIAKLKLNDIQKFVLSAREIGTITEEKQNEKTEQKRYY